MIRIFCQRCNAIVAEAAATIEIDRSFHFNQHEDVCPDCKLTRALAERTIRFLCSVQNVTFVSHRRVHGGFID